MSIDIRQVSHPEAVKRFDTQELRRHFLIEQLFVPGAVTLTYSHLDRLIVGGAQPGDGPLALPTPGAVGTPMLPETARARRSSTSAVPAASRSAATSHDLRASATRSMSAWVPAR